MVEQMLTTEQAARQLGVSRDTVKRWCRARRIPGARLHLGNRRIGWRIPAASVAAMLAEGG